MTTDFEGIKSSKYVVKGSYLYYHYMQDNDIDLGAEGARIERPLGE